MNLGRGLPSQLRAFAKLVVIIGAGALLADAYWSARHATELLPAFATAVFRRLLALSPAISAGFAAFVAVRLARHRHHPYLAFLVGAMLFLAMLAALQRLPSMLPDGSSPSQNTPSGQ